MSGILCSICAKEFKDTSRVNQHMKEVHEENAIVCETCGKSFQNRAKLVIHVQKTHTRTNQQIACDQCERVFKSKQQATSHKITVHTVEVVKCHICNSELRNKIRLSRHLKLCEKRRSNVANNKKVGQNQFTKDRKFENLAEDFKPNSKSGDDLTSEFPSLLKNDTKKDDLNLKSDSFGSVFIKALKTFNDSLVDSALDEASLKEDSLDSMKLYDTAPSLN